MSMDIDNRSLIRVSNLSYSSNNWSNLYFLRVKSISDLIYDLNRVVDK